VLLYSCFEIRRIRRIMYDPATDDEEAIEEELSGSEEPDGETKYDKGELEAGGADDDLEALIMGGDDEGVVNDEDGEQEVPLADINGNPIE
jgi:hypothetical protein